MNECGWLAMGVLFLQASITDNILLTRFFGACSFVAVSRHLRTAAGLGLAVTCVTVCTAVLDWLIYWGVLAPGAPLCPADLAYLHLIVFVMTIAAFVQLAEMVIERLSPLLHARLGIYLPLITVNCAVLGVSLLVIRADAGGRSAGLVATAVFALGAGLGWLLAICLMAGIRQRLRHAPVPAPLQGLGITMLAAGLMSIAFVGFKDVGPGLARAVGLVVGGGAP